MHGTSAEIIPGFIFFQLPPRTRHGKAKLSGHAALSSTVLPWERKDKKR
jgi:hypothetical protein